MAKSKIPESEHPNICRMAQQGRTLDYICGKYDVQKLAIKLILRKYGVEPVLGKSRRIGAVMPGTRNR